jgi:hypothetical protein
VKDALESIYEDLWSAEYRISGDQAHAKEWARTLLDAHAHELAEKIRRDADRDTDWVKGAGNRGDALEYAADLIDPEVTE